MLKVRSLVGVAAALIATPLMGLPAWGAACVPGTVASYEALGNTGCTVGPLTFFNIDITTAGFGGGVINTISLSPFTEFGEFGLQLIYSAIAQTNSNFPLGASTDLAWTMGVAGPPAIIDAFASITGTVTGTGSVSLGEQIFNGLTGQQIGAISLTAPNTSQTIFFPPTDSIFVMKNQANFSGIEGNAFTSILVNAYSVVPGPIAGAGLPGVVAACGGLLALARRRRRQIA
jgi:hypothetical protein